MASRGKSINIFLMDGEPSGRIKCTLANWTGVAYKIPRTALDLCKERSDLKQSGIYFLFGTSDQTGNNIVYIGQAGARKNGNDPTQGNITEEKESELEEFVDYARIIMGTLGHKVFEPIAFASPTAVADDPKIADEEPLLYFNRAALKATGQRTSEGFVVFKGSEVSPTLHKSCPESALKLRDKHAAKIDAHHLLLEDILFSSPSAAMAFIGGTSANGRMLWKTADGVSLKDLENAEE